MKNKKGLIPVLRTAKGDIELVGVGKWAKDKPISRGYQLLLAGQPSLQAGGGNLRRFRVMHRFDPSTR